MKKFDYLSDACEKILSLLENKDYCTKPKLYNWELIRDNVAGVKKGSLDEALNELKAYDW